MKKVIVYSLKGLLYLVAAAAFVVVMAVGLFLYVVFAALAYGLPASGYGHVIGYSDSSFKRWWWWRQSRMWN
jgi:hypothetical protein